MVWMTSNNRNITWTISHYLTNSDYFANLGLGGVGTLLCHSVSSLSLSLNWSDERCFYFTDPLLIHDPLTYVTLSLMTMAKVLMMLLLLTHRHMCPYTPENSKSNRLDEPAGLSFHLFDNDWHDRHFDDTTQRTSIYVSFIWYYTPKPTWCEKSNLLDIISLNYINIVILERKKEGKFVSHSDRFRPTGMRHLE